MRYDVCPPAPQPPPPLDAGPPLAVVAGCGCCLLLSLVTLALLLLRCRPGSQQQQPHRAHFLKLQCCAATVAAMAVFLHAEHRPPPPVSGVGSTAHITNALAGRPTQGRAVVVRHACQLALACGLGAWRRALTR